MPYLHIGRQTLELRPGETVVGSGAQASWRMPDLDLAPQHFSVTVEPQGSARVCAVSAQHVVVVDGHQVGLDGLELTDGAAIGAGGGRFVYTARPLLESADRAEDAAVEPAVLLDDTARRAYAVGTGELTIGRDRASTVIVRDPSVSRVHAEIVAEAGRHVIHSVGSGGTRVNGYRISAPHVLEEGDRVEIGEVRLLYTRRPPPPGYATAPTREAGGDDLGNRSTIIHRRFDPSSGGIRTGLRAMRIALLIGVAVAVLALALLFAS